MEGESWLAEGQWEVFSKQPGDIWSFILNNSTLRGVFHRMIDLLNCSRESDIEG